MRKMSKHRRSKKAAVKKFMQKYFPVRNYPMFWR